MLSHAIIELNAENRRTDKEELVLASFPPKLALAHYQRLIQWIQETVNTVPSLNPTILTQSCTALKLTHMTCYLARVYLDKAIDFYRILPTQNPVLLAIICMSLAINFSEPRNVSERQTLQKLLEESECEASSGELCYLLEAVTTALSFNLRYTTPNDYFPIFFHCFPWYPQLEKAINMVLKLVLALPEACQYTAEQVFYGSLLAILAYRGVIISQLQSQILQSLTDCWQKASILRDRILLELNQPEDEIQPQQ